MVNIFYGESSLQIVKFHHFSPLQPTHLAFFLSLRRIL